MVAVATEAPHPPVAGMVLVTVYVPGVHPERFTFPFEKFITNVPVPVPANVPATAPVPNVGKGFTEA